MNVDNLKLDKNQSNFCTVEQWLSNLSYPQCIIPVYDIPDQEEC